VSGVFKQRTGDVGVETLNIVKHIEKPFFEEFYHVSANATQTETATDAFIFHVLS